MILNPKPYQHEALKFVLERPRAGLFMDMGLGKTSISLAAISELMRAGHVSKTLIVAPIRVLENVWPAEIEKWDNFNHLRFLNLNGQADSKHPFPDADIYGINPESFKTLVRNPKFAKIPVQLLIVDESSMFKNPAAMRFKAMRDVLYRYKYRWILTGTAAPNGLEDLWAQIYILDRGESLGPNITWFRREFCAKGYDELYEVTEQGKRAIFERVSHLVLRMDKKHCLVMPELIFNRIAVSLPAPAQRLYRDMERKFLAVLASGETVASPNAAVAGMRCRQMANGGVYLPDGTAEHIHNAKADALKGLVDDLQGDPLLVFYEFKHDLDRIAKVLGDVPNLSGEKNTQQMVEDFNAGRIPVMTAYGASAGYGLNLQGACSNVCWMGVPWALDMHDQSNARVWRQGQSSSSVTIHYLMAKGTLDYKVIDVLAKKDRDQQELYAAIQGVSPPSTH